MRRYSPVVLWISLFCCAIFGAAQNTPVVAIDPAGENGRVHLAPLDAAAQAALNKWAQSPAMQEYRPFALLLQNSSGLAVVGITIRWAAKSPERSGVYVSSTDSFGMGARNASSASFIVPVPGQAPAQQNRLLGSSWSGAEGSVLDSGERMIVAPGLFLRETPKDRSGLNGWSGMPDAFRTAESVTASLDTVILSDGQVLGPDESHILDALRAQKASIDELANAVRIAEQSGQDPIAALRELATMRPAPASAGPTMQQRQLARQLMNARDWKARLEKLAAIQLPHFQR